MSADPNPSPAPAPPPCSLAILIVLWCVKLIAAAALGYASYLKMTSAPVEIELFTKLEMEPEGRYLIGALEGLAALALLVPQSAVYGAFLGLGIMCGAVMGHLTKLGLPGIEFALLVAACCVVVLYIRRHDAPFIGNLLDQ